MPELLARYARCVSCWGRAGDQQPTCRWCNACRPAGAESISQQNFAGGSAGCVPQLEGKASEIIHAHHHQVPFCACCVPAASKPSLSCLPCMLSDLQVLLLAAAGAMVAEQPGCRLRSTAVFAGSASAGNAVPHSEPCLHCIEARLQASCGCCSTKPAGTGNTPDKSDGALLHPTPAAGLMHKC